MSALAGTAPLLRLWLRRDRVMIPLWVLALTATAAGTASSFATLYGTPAELHVFAAGVKGNAATVALYGPVGAETVGGLVAWRNGVIGAVLVAVMSVLLVIRHTRAEEEEGRLELVGATAVGRRAPLTSGVLTSLTAGAVLSLTTFLGLTGTGMAVAGSAAFALAWFASGLVFTGVAAVTAQLSESTRTARGIAFAVLGGVYLLRAAGDTADAAWLSWLSPLGWASLLRPFADERWWVAGLSLVLAAALLAAAFALADRRDVGAGIFPPRLGPAAGSLSGSAALAWRLQRGSFFGWLAAFTVYGGVIGGIAPSVADLVGESTATQEIFATLGGEGAFTDAFLAVTFGMLALIATVFTVQSVLRMRGEESGGRLEPLLATGLNRIRWAAGHTVIALAGTLVLLTVGGLACGVVYGLASDDLGQIGRLAAAGAVQAPPAWVVGGAALLLFGALPRQAYAAWGLFGACILLTLVAPILDLPAWVLDLSPFAHAPALPGGEIEPLPVTVLLVLAAALAAAGLTTWRRRDLTP
ncbi:ABC-2 type transport system permease protein [Actinocorallia herbida]|uniref:ABC-2 type transport system permease protein n=1 Tax=Actinocorallia herbida TaxID=58109 RepID=A0A3N1CYZ0_9ACTN|nr:ABC transporter permease [Actinocorallia herbida]ROO86490.1 ABC-2 type transport system permease protein [Actinocorallia herbida]